MTATPRGLCERYTERLYAEMRDDAQRTSAYEDALRHLAAGRVVLDLGTGGLALLAVMAARPNVEMALAEARDVSRAALDVDDGLGVA